MKSFFFSRLVIVTVVVTGCAVNEPEDETDEEQEVSLPLTHSQYSFGLSSTNLGAASRQGVNPFTKELVSFPVDGELTPSQIQAVKEAFSRYQIKRPEPDFEGYAAYWSGGERIRFRGGDFESDEISIQGLAVTIVTKELKTQQLQIVLDVAKAGDFALNTGIGLEDMLVVDVEPTPALRERFPGIKMIRTTEELRKWLNEKVGAFKVHVAEDG